MDWEEKVGDKKKGHADIFIGLFRSGVMDARDRRKTWTELWGSPQQEREG